ncbi:MAG: hypothetical protein GKR94_13025 [Gammaproteobacteria bacterium]|nr:hypothetical protein [Gammaproteobacteria bacterium]
METTPRARARITASGRTTDETHGVLVLRSAGEPPVETAEAALRQRAMEHGIAVHDEVEEAARSPGAIALLEKRLQNLHAPTQLNSC